MPVTSDAIRGSVILLGNDSAGLPIISASVVIERGGRLKYLVGLDSGDRLVVAFDDLVNLHDDLAKLHNLRPIGGGWLEIDLAQKRLRLSGRSKAYAKEPDRQLTAGMLRRALSEFICSAS